MENEIFDWVINMLDDKNCNLHVKATVIAEKITSLETRVAKYREVLTIISDDMTCDAITLAKQALEEGK